MRPTKKESHFRHFHQCNLPQHSFRSLVILAIEATVLSVQEKYEIWLLYRRWYIIAIVCANGYRDSL